MKTRNITIKVSETNYQHLEEIAERFSRKERSKEKMTVEQLVQLAVVDAFHALDVEAYTIDEVVPVSLTVKGIVAVSPGSASEDDIGRCTNLIIHRLITALPYNRLNISVSSVKKKAAQVKEWKNICRYQ